MIISFVVYDPATGVVLTGTKFTAQQTANASELIAKNTPAGRSSLQVPSDHDVLTNPAGYKVVNRVLTTV